MEPINAGWLILSIFVISLGNTFIYLSLYNKNKRMLMFGISFLTSSICYMMLSLNIQENLYNLYQWTSFPIMMAIFICAVERLFRISSFDGLFNAFLLILFTTLGIFLLIPREYLLYIHAVRIALAITLVATLTYLSFKREKWSNILFLFSILCYTVAGVAQSRGNLPVSLASFSLGYVFILMISFLREREDRNGVSIFFDMRRELEILQKRLSRITQEQKIILENIPAMVYMKDEDGRFSTVNRSFQEFVKNLGIKGKGMLGRRSEEIFPSKYLELFAEDDEILRSGKTRFDILKEIDIDGRRVWLNMDKIPYSVHGKVRGLICIADDLTELIEKERSLEESERRFRALAENSPIDILVIRDGRFVYANFDVSKVTGYSREEILSKDFLEMVHPDFREMIKKKYLSLLAGKKVSPIECKILDKDGGERWALIGGSLIEWEGKPSILIAVTDITDRKRAEEEAIKAKRYMENILHAAGDGIRIIGLDYRVRMLNRRMARMAKVRMKEGVGMRCSEMFRSDVCGTEECSLRRVLRTGRGFQKESLRYSTDGKAIPCLQMVSPLKDSKGRIVGIIEDFRDIRMIKRVEKRLRKAHEMLKRRKEQLERLNNLKSLFLNITSHELRTPMTAIRGYAQLLTLEKFGRIGDEQKKILETIIRNIDRLDKLLNDILDVSRLESGTLKITPERCRIEEIIDNAVETMEGHARLKNIRIEKMVEYDLPDLLLDKNRMEQVITNLLSNAIKFSNRNSRILVRAKRDGENVVLEVQDFGRGIPKSKLNKIFEPFYQVDTGMDRKFGGAGLGLTIVKGIVEAHGGKVEVDSKLGEGSTFRIILPVEHVEKKGKVKIFSER